MVQKFSSEETERKLYEVFKFVIDITQFDLSRYHALAYGSKELGEALFDLKLIPVYNILSRELLVRTYNIILEAQERCGSINSYIEVIRAIYGDAQITFTMTPLHIRIDILAEYTDFRQWITRGVKKRIVTPTPEQMIFKRILRDISNKQLRDLLLAMTNYGTYAEFTLNGTPL